MNNYRNYILLAVITVILLFAIYSFVCDNKKNIISEDKKSMNQEIKLIINDKELIIELEDNEAANELVKRLKYGLIKISAEDYGNFEKVGELGFSLPTNDVMITTKPGDVILYQGNKICIYYDENTWKFTKLGHIKNISEEELKDLLKEKEIVYKLSL